MELKIRNISEIFRDLPAGNKFRTDKPSIQTMQVFGMDLVYFCAKDTALEFSSLWCFCGSGSTTQSVCFSNLSWPYPWVKRYETSAGNPAWLTYAQPQFVILCAGDMTDSLYIFLCFSIRLTRLAWKKMPGWPTSSESGTTFGSSFHSRHDDRKIGTLNAQKESTGRSGRLEIGRDAKFGGCCKLATFTWRCLIDLDWIRWLFMFFRQKVKHQQAQPALQCQPSGTLWSAAEMKGFT